MGKKQDIEKLLEAFSKIKKPKFEDGEVVDANIVDEATPDFNLSPKTRQDVYNQLLKKYTDLQKPSEDAMSEKAAGWLDAAQGIGNVIARATGQDETSPINALASVREQKKQELQNTLSALKVLGAESKVKPMQQTDLFLSGVGPVAFDPTLGYINATTKQALTADQVKSLEKKYKDFAMIKDPTTGLIKTFKKGQGVGDGSQDKPFEKFEELNPNEKKIVLDHAEGYRKELDKVRDYQNTLDSLNTFVGDNIDGTVGTIQRQFARTIGGEKGVMTDMDVKSFGGSEKFITRLAQLAHQNINGGLSPEVQKNFENMLGIARKIAEKKSQKLQETYIKPVKFYLGKRAGDEFVKQSLGMGVESPTTLDKVIVEKDGKRFRLPKSQLEAAKKQGYKLVE